MLFKTCNHSFLFTDTTRTCSTFNSTLFQSLLDENHKLGIQWKILNFGKFTIH